MAPNTRVKLTRKKPKQLSKYVVSCDPGKRQDYTAISIIEEVITPDGDLFYALRNLVRPPLGTPHHANCSMLIDIMRRTEALGKTTLVIDATGIGDPFFEMLTAYGLKPVGIVITGGGTVTKKRENGHRLIHVPKEFLITNAQIATQTKGMFRIPRNLWLAQIFLGELRSYQYKITQHANTVYSPRGDSIHDDLVLSASMGLYYIQKYGQEPEVRFRWVV